MQAIKRLQRRVPGHPLLAVCGVLLLSAVFCRTSVAQLAAASDSVTSRRGATGLVHLDVALGFNNTFRLGHWAPVSVAVSNRGRDIAGHLELVVGRSVGSADDAEAIVHSRPLGLARDATKRLSFTVRLESFGTPLIARVRVGKAIIAEKRLPLRDHFTDARLVLVLSRDADLDYLNDGAGRRTRVLYPHPERLPHRWQGYDGVEAVIVHGVSLANLAPAQTRALRLWIEAGGTFVFSASPDYSNALERTLATLLPGVPSGSVRIRDLGDVGDGLGLPKAFERPFDVHQISRYRGQVLARAGNTPLIIEEARGKGRSIYLAFDVSRYPFQNWNGSRALLTKLLAFAAPPPVSVGAKDEVEHLAKDALRAGAVRFPSHMTLVVFVVVYLGVLLAGCTATFSSSLRLWLLPWFSWAAPVLFAPLAYLIFGPSLYPAGASAVVVSVIEPLSNSAKALLQVDIAIFANRAIPLRFEYDRVRPVWRRPDVAAGGDRTGWTIGGGAAAFVQPRAESPYRLFLLSGTGVADFDLKVAGTRDVGEIALTVVNRAPLPLRAAWFFHAERVYSIGAIGAGTNQTLRLQEVQSKPMQPLTIEQLVASSVVGEELDEQAKLSSLTATVKRYVRTAPERGVLIGFAPALLQARGGASEWQLRDNSLVVLPVALPLRLTREEEKLPNGTVEQGPDDQD